MKNARPQTSQTLKLRAALVKAGVTGEQIESVLSAVNPKREPAIRLSFDDRKRIISCLPKTGDKCVVIRTSKGVRVIPMHEWKASIERAKTHKPWLKKKAKATAKTGEGGDAKAGA